MKIEINEFEKRCSEIAKKIKMNKNINSIYGIPRGGLIPAVRISHLVNLPLVLFPHKNTAVIDDCIDSGETKKIFQFHKYFFVLIDKKEEKINEWIEFWWEKK